MSGGRRDWWPHMEKVSKSVWSPVRRGELSWSWETLSLSSSWYWFLFYLLYYKCLRAMDVHYYSLLVLNWCSGHDYDSLSQRWLLRPCTGSNRTSFSLPHRVEKKERARLKTVKFHARTGMIESNRVSGDPQGSQPYVKRHKKLEIYLVDKRTGEHKRISLFRVLPLSYQNTDCFSESRERGHPNSTARVTPLSWVTGSWRCVGAALSGRLSFLGHMKAFVGISLAVDPFGAMGTLNRAWLHQPARKASLRAPTVLQTKQSMRALSIHPFSSVSFAGQRTSGAVEGRETWSRWLFVYQWHLRECVQEATVTFVI